VQRDQQHRRRGGLDHHDGPPVEQDPGEHRQAGGDSDLPRARAGRGRDRGGDADAEHDAGDEVERLPAAGAGSGAHRDHRRDRREEGPRVVRDQAREPPRERGRDRGLQHAQERRSQRQPTVVGKGAELRHRRSATASTASCRIG
jgi:hypothetical protein